MASAATHPFDVYTQVRTDVATSTRPRATVQIAGLAPSVGIVYSAIIEVIHGDLPMAVLTIRNIDDSLKTRLRVAAAQRGCSMEEEARRILREALAPPVAETNLGTRLHQRVLEVSGGAELPPPTRSQPRAAPTFADNEP